MSAELALDDVNSTARFHVIAVCTGNVCRSPAVERLLHATLTAGSSVRVSSAGTEALVGQPIAGPMAELLRDRGADTDQFAARQLATPMVASADLVIALTRRHRSAAVALHPQSLRRALTLRELAHLATDVQPAALDAASEGPTTAHRLAALVPLAIARRAYQQVNPADYDVIDPWRRSDAVYRESMRQITEAIEKIAMVLDR